MQALNKIKKCFQHFFVFTACEILPNTFVLSTTQQLMSIINFNLHPSWLSQFTKFTNKTINYLIKKIDLLSKNPKPLYIYLVEKLLIYSHLNLHIYKSDQFKTWTTATSISDHVHVIRFEVFSSTIFTVRRCLLATSHVSLGLLKITLARLWP